MWRILVVDDEDVNRKLIREILAEKAECVEAADGEQCISEFKESLKSNKPFDAILMDIAMPGIHGLEALKIVRDIEKAQGIRFGSGVRVVMVTAHGKPFSKAFQEGADFYILKPIDPDELIKQLEGVLKPLFPPTNE